MNIIPLRQKITVVKKGVDDGWGKFTEGARVVYKARVQESDKVIKASGGQNNVYGVHAEGAFDGVKVIIKGLADISLDDTVEYVDELGRTHVYNPTRIDVKRWFNGKAIYTFVFV